MAESDAGLLDEIVEGRTDVEAAGAPIGGLAAHLVDLAACQLDQQVIGPLALHERAGGAHEQAAVGNSPGRGQEPAFVHRADELDLTFKARLDERHPRHVVGAAEHETVFQFPDRVRGDSGR